MRLLLVFFSAITLSASVLAQEPGILPRPVEMTIQRGQLNLGNKIILIYDKQLENSATFLKDYLVQYYQIQSVLIKTRGGKLPKTNFISLRLDKNAVEGGYSLVAGKESLTIKGSESGVFYGIQTLIQLLPTDRMDTEFSIQQVTIKDYPRFGYRGMLLDVGRHFFPIEFIKKYIDFIALHKMNYFQWHLTDDQGWRIEIKKYPNLTKVGAWRNGTIIGLWPGTGFDSTRHGGYYTQDQIKEIVEYAQKRYITIIPEIEMPGHSLGALSSYPELGCTGGPYKVKETWGYSDDVFCAGKEQTYQFIQDVLTEVMELFPSRYIHIGGDECPVTNWKKCPKCQSMIKKQHLKDEHELQSYFIRRIEEYVNKKGRIIIGWDEILEGGLAPNAVVMSWHGEEGGIKAASNKHQVIMTPSNICYFDYRQKEKEDSITTGWSDWVLTVRKVYDYEPIPAELKAEYRKYILGAQGNVWTEYMNNSRIVEYMIFPRMTALSEVLWSPKENRNWNDFEKRMKFQFRRYDLWNYSYHKEPMN